MAKPFTSISEIRDLVNSQGALIKWCGCIDIRSVSILLVHRDGEMEYLRVDAREIRREPENLQSLSFVEATSDHDVLPRFLPEDGTRLSLLRRAAVLGINRGGTLYSGVGSVYGGQKCCTLSYDLETSTEDSLPSGFPLSSARILSIAALCTCGYEFYADGVVDSYASGQLAEMFIAATQDHRPDWLIGWNCYSFDNECLRYHIDSSLKTHFVVTRGGSAKKATYGSTLNLPGIYNVDLYVYLSRSQSHVFKNFKLSNVAEQLDVTRKMEMPQMSQTVDPMVLQDYNINDCKVVLDIWVKTGSDQSLPTLALCMCSPIYDSSRYVTGSMASTSVSSYLLSKGMTSRWSKCEKDADFQGGLVLEPLRGYYTDIVVCDFKSMYPSIMAGCNISPHSFQITKSDCQKDSVVLTGKDIRIKHGEELVTFAREPETHLASFMRFLIDERDRQRKKLPVYAGVLKVASNSVYGSLGYHNSSLFSPLCSSSVTAIGRYCLGRSKEIFESVGLKVIYGDTDSCFVVSNTPGMCTEPLVLKGLDELHTLWRDTPLSSMKMELEAHYSAGILIDKKRYCLLRGDDTVKYVGVSPARRDVAALTRSAAVLAAEAILRFGTERGGQIISEYFNTVILRAMRRGFTLSEVSRHTQKDGKKGFTYKHESGSTNFVPEESAHMDETVECNVGELVSNVAEEIRRFTLPCGMHTIRELLEKHSVDL